MSDLIKVNFGTNDARKARLKSSLNRINQLMRELRHMDNETSNTNVISLFGNNEPTTQGTSAMSTDKDDILKELARDIEREIEDYDLNVDNVSTDYVESFGYREADASEILQNIESECLDTNDYEQVHAFLQLKTILEKSGEGVFFDVLGGATEVGLSDDYRCVENEMFSHPVGYYLVSLYSTSEECIRKYFELSEDDQAKVKSMIAYELVDEGDDWIDFEVECDYRRVYLTLYLNDLFDHFKSIKEKYCF